MDIRDKDEDLWNAEPTIPEVTVPFYVNTEDGVPVHYVDFYDLFLAGKYRVPYSRWAAETHRRYDIPVIRSLKKDNDTGRPRIHYYARLDDSKKMVNDLARRRKIALVFV
jgi:hypothetical protein